MQYIYGVKKRIIAALIVLSFCAMGTGCSSVNVSRDDLDQNVVLTDRWSDEDSRLVVNEMIPGMFSSSWFERFSKEYPGKEPAITIQKIQNKSHGYISVDAFVNDIKRAVVRNGMAKIVVNGGDMEPQFALSGSINSMVDQLDGKRVTFYQIDMKLINLQTTHEVWSGQKKIKKILGRSRFLF